MRPFIHIGYQKTASTWLQRRIFSDSSAGFHYIAGPEELRAAFVEVDPFDFDAGVTRGPSVPKIEAARERGLVPTLSCERFVGPPHRGGYDGKFIADRLADTFPDARILMVIREQSSMVLSLYKMYVRMGGAASFRQYIAPPPTGGSRAPLFRFDFLEYHRTIDYYFRLFGSENVLVLPCEMLAQQPVAFLQRFASFVGGPEIRAPFKRVNTSPSAFTLSIKRHANKWIVWDSMNPAPVLPINVPNGPLRRLTGTHDRKVPAALRDASDRRWRSLADEQVGGLYAESNALTEGLTSLDLGSLGYAR